MRASFITFICIGAFASVVNLGVRVALGTIASYEVAIIGAFFVALVTAFQLNRWFVFRAKGANWLTQFWRFFLVNLAALGQVLLVSELLDRVVFPRLGMRFHPETVAHAVGLVVPLFTSFWLHRRFTFAVARNRISETGVAL